MSFLKMSSKRLLVCFDAFDTLFTPRTPVIQQYGEVARALGLRGFSDDELAIAFAAAYKAESKHNPNFGKATGLGPVKWWTNIIEGSFHKVTQQPLPEELAPRLIRRFHCDEGYRLFPDVKPLLAKLRAYSRRTDSNIMVGVVSNSDDRITDILTTGFGFKINPVRYGGPVKPPVEDVDFDFTVISYDIGHEKPDRRIFDAAVELSDALVKLSGQPSTYTWDKLYIGDEHKKDVVGALAAGWKVALIDRSGSQPKDDLVTLDSSDTTTLFEAFEKHRALCFNDLAELDRRIPG